jgi:hypothetical protein
MTERDRQRMLRHLLLILGLLPELVRQALDPLTEDEQLEVLEALQVDAAAVDAMADDPGAPGPFQPAANLVRRLVDLVDPAPVIAGKLQRYADIFVRLRDLNAHHQLFPDDVQH